MQTYLTIAVSIAGVVASVVALLFQFRALRSQVLEIKKLKVEVEESATEKLRIHLTPSIESTKSREEILEQVRQLLESAMENQQSDIVYIGSAGLVVDVPDNETDDAGEDTRGPAAQEGDE